MNNEILLQVKNLSVVSKTQTIVKKISFEIHKGQIFALVGESGSGKSLTALAVVDLLAKGLQKSGEIIYQNQDLMKYTNIRSLRGAQIAFIFQDPAECLNPLMRLGEQVNEVLRLHSNLNKKQRKTRVFELFEQVDIDNHEQMYQRYPHQVSGGQKQRIMIASALAGGVKLLIADEPTTALDVSTQKQVLELLLRLQETQNLSILFITHDLSSVRFIANRVAVMYQGRIIENQAKNDFFKSPKQPHSKALLTVLAKKNKALKPNTEVLLKGQKLKVYFPIKSGFLQRTTDYVRAVDAVDFVLKQGQNLAIVGESGSGKTTLGKTIMQQIGLHQGDITLANIPISNYGRKAYAHKVQIVFQNISSGFNPRMRIAQTLLEVLLTLNPASANLEKVAALLTAVELSPELMHRYPHQLSGGQLQRLSIARAISAKPNIIICDEPTSALDANIKVQILDLLLKLQTQQDISYIIITHDISIVNYFADAVMVMKHGKIVEYGATEEVLQNPKNSYTKMLLSSVLTA